MANKPSLSKFNERHKLTYTLIFKLLKIKDTVTALKAAREKIHYTEEQRFKSPQTHQKSWKPEDTKLKSIRGKNLSISSGNIFQ